MRLRRIVAAAVLMIGGTALAPMPAWSAGHHEGRASFSGGLDTAFGVNGKATAPLGDAGPIAIFNGRGGAVVLAAGFSDAAVVRFSRSGSSHREEVGRPGQPIGIWTATSDTERRLLIGGTQSIGDFLLGRTPAVARLSPDGRSDRSFGSGGVATLGPVADGFDAASLRASRDRIIVASVPFIPSPDRFLISAFNGDGSVDTSFANAGNRLVKAVRGSTRPLVYAADGSLFTFGSVGTGMRRALVIASYGAGGELDTGFGVGGIMRSRRLAGADAFLVAQTPAAALMVARAEPQTGSLLVARITNRGHIDRSFGADGVARIRLGSSARTPALVPTHGGGVAVLAGLRGALAAALLDRSGSPVVGFGARGVQCLAVDDGSDGLPSVFRPVAQAAGTALTVAAIARSSEINDVAVAKMRWVAPRALACTSAVERGGVIRVSGVRSRSGRLVLVLRRPGRRGRAGGLVGTVRFAQRAAGAHADQWNRRLHGRRLGCQALVASPRLVSAGGRVLGIDAPFAVYPNCPGPDV